MYNLLVCDDEQIMIESVRHIVEKEFRDLRVIETARSGREAIEKTLTTKPDIILTDIRMPGINGLDAIKEIKRVHNDVKIVIGPMMMDRVVVYVAQNVNDLYVQRVQSISIIDEILHQLEEKYKVEFRVGIGRIHRDQDIMISYQEALRALNFTEGGRCVHIDDAAPHVYDGGYDIVNQEHRLIAGLENGDVQKCLTILSDIFRKYPNFFEQENIHYRIIEMMAAVRRVATENGVQSHVEPGHAMKRILACKTAEEFEQVCTEEIRQMACAINTGKKCNIGKIVEKTNILINERFNQDINLEEISRELHISPQYLSRLYKNETGENFIDRLTAVRIEHAKRLIREGQFSIKEICYMSGYSDPNYFSKLFKKHVGISPTDYQKQSQ